MLIPNIVFILHKEQFSMTKIAKYYLFSMELDSFTHSDKTKKLRVQYGAFTSVHQPQPENDEMKKEMNGRYKRQFL
jgi:hypothetical protein